MPALKERYMPEVGKNISHSPNGETFLLPSEADYDKEYLRLKELTVQQKKLDREIVVVMGIGFVGAVMAGVIADSTDANGNPSKFVIGMQRPSTRSYWKIPYLNKGIAPVEAEDPDSQTRLQLRMVC